MLMNPEDTVTFKRGQQVSYKDKGIGEITDIGLVEAGGMKFDAYTIKFADGLIRIPRNKMSESGVRLVSSEDSVPRVIATLKKARRGSGGRGKWHLRALQYNTKLQSGDLILIAEVMRDLHCEDDSWTPSERQFYLKASQILIKEVAAIKRLSITEAVQFLSKESDKKLQYVSGQIEVTEIRRTTDRQNYRVVDDRPVDAPTPTKKISQSPKAVAAKVKPVKSEPVATIRFDVRNAILERKVAELQQTIEENQGVLTAQVKKAVSDAERPLLFKISELETELGVVRQKLADKEASSASQKKVTIVEDGKSLDFKPSPTGAPKGWIRNSDGSLRRAPKDK